MLKSPQTFFSKGAGFKKILPLCLPRLFVEEENHRVWIYPFELWMGEGGYFLY